MIDEIVREEKKYRSFIDEIKNLVLSKTQKSFYLLKKGVSLRKIINAAGCIFSLKIKSPQVFGYPYSIIIEPTNLCGLKCPLCPTGTGTLNRAKGSMSFDIFKQIIDEMNDFLIEIYLTNYGEPFLNKDIYKMIEYAKQRKIEVCVASNAMVWQGIDDIRKLIATKLDKLIVSVDGASNQTYLAYRKKGNFEKVIENLKIIGEEKKRIGTSTPYTELQFIIMKHNEHEIPIIREIAEKIKVDCLVLKPVTFNNADWHNPEILSQYREYMPSLEKYQVYHLTPNSIEWKEKIKNKCDSLWRTMVILWDGIIVPCCLDPHGEIKMGTISSGIKNIWNNAKYRNLRRQIIKNKKNISLCSNCLGMN